MQHRRRFIRHPVAIPLEVRAADPQRQGMERMLDVSVGGLCFHSDQPLAVASRVQLRLPLIDPEFVASGEVVWCRSVVQGFDIGVALSGAQDRYRTRMVEQICHIEAYRRGQAELGRQLSGEQAAGEWIERYGAHFPEAD